MPIDIDTIIIIALITAVGLLTAEVTRLAGRLHKVFIGKDGEDLEESIVEIIRHIRDLEHRGADADKLMANLDERLKKSLQKFHTVRFNPFPDQGGNQSFATCFMDEEGNGVVLSSLYARDKVSIYAKPLAKYQSQYELSEEEQAAINNVK